MGCDIHIITEIKKNGKWQYVPEIPDTFNQKNYGLFALLAGVRNSFDIKGFAPKGLPDDISGKKFNFESYTETGKKRYEDPNDTVLVFVDMERNIKMPYDVPTTNITENQYNAISELAKTNPEACARWYYGLGWSETGNERKYYVHDAKTDNGHFERVPWKTAFPRFNDFMAYMYEDEYDKERGEYGRYHINFESPEYHTPSFLSLDELVNGDYSDYFAQKYKMDKSFYNDFIALGGKLPEGMRVVEREISDFIDAIQYAVMPTVMIVYEKKDADKNDSPLYKGIDELKNIAAKYGIENYSDIRIVFAFDN